MVYTIEQLQERIAPIAAKYRLPAVYLFGSYARGEATDESDVDILVDCTGSSVRGFAMGGLFEDFAEAVGKEIDLVTADTLKQEHTRRRRPHFVDNLETDRVQIYG